MPGTDGRNKWCRRARDIIESISLDLAAQPEELSEAQRAIIRRCAVLIVELEQMECRFALAGEASPAAIDLYQRTASGLRRMLEAIGLQKHKDTTLDLQTYLARRRTVPDEAAA